MKMFLFILLFPFMLFSANLIQNPGFETWAADDSIPNNWLIENNYYVCSAKESTNVFAGNYSIKLDRIRAGNDGIKQFVKSGISSGDTFVFSMYVLDNDSTRIGGFLRTYKHGGGDSTVFLPYSSDNTSFQQIADTFVTPNGACSIGVFIRLYKDTADSGVAFVDSTYLDIHSTGPHQPPFLYDEEKTPDNVTSDDDVVTFISVSTDDNATIAADTMFYKINDNGVFTAVNHDSMSQQTYYYSIPKQSTGDTIFYYYKFKDSDDSIAISDTLSYVVQPKNVPDVFINEIMYNPSSSQGTDDHCEYLELWNLEGSTVDMTGWTLSDGEATFTFPSLQVAANYFVVVCRDTDSIRGFYQTKALGDGDDYLLGNMSLALGNSGDQVILKTGNSTLVDSVNYDDASPWPTAPDGGGPSLELVDPMNYASHNQGSGWAASADNGTPGDINSTYNPSGISTESHDTPPISLIKYRNLHLSVNSPYEGKKSVSLYDISGKLRFKKIFFSKSKTFKLSDFGNGVYFAHIKSLHEDGVKKIVIIK
ncbi:MAG TPA: T9SS type A sorting domain-containing protein [Firmicutes bacterium]|nr:T9SS type A sorting domain-containing protein [Bacillota bacterium]